jgi:hypothetical protein
MVGEAGSNPQPRLRRPVLYPIELIALDPMVYADILRNMVAVEEATCNPVLNGFRERQYFTNVTVTTTEWRRRCHSWLPSDAPTQEDLKAFVLRTPAPVGA